MKQFDEILTLIKGYVSESRFSNLFRNSSYAYHSASSRRADHNRISWVRFQIPAGRRWLVPVLPLEMLTPDLPAP